jgi:hypothetical protein
MTSRLPRFDYPRMQSLFYRSVLPLRRKIQLAFGCLAFLVGICGVVGLFYFERIAGSISVLSNVSAPLLIKSIELQRNVNRMRWVLFQNADSDNADDQLKTLLSLEVQGHAQAEELRRLAHEVKLPPPLESIDQLQKGNRNRLDTSWPSKQSGV